MENIIANTDTAENIFCAACHQQTTTDFTFCNNCGYPLKGTEEEQQNFMTQLTVNQIDLEEYHNKIKKGRNSLYYVAVAFAVGTLLEIAQASDQSLKVAMLIVCLIVCSIFVFLAIWSKRKPLAALVSGSALYGILIASSAIVDPLSLFKGIILKIIVIVCLINGIRAALDAEKMKKETHLG